MSALTCVGLAKRYGATYALQDCSLDIPAGRVVAMVGPNGAGKTTLLHMSVGLARPSAGHITVLDGLAPGAAAARQRVAFVAQDAPLYPGLTVVDAVHLIGGLNRRWDEPLALERMEELAIPLHRRVGLLSGGQRAQLALALAVARRPDLIVLDEPTARLDPLARADFTAALMRSVADTGMSVIFSSHALEDLERTCDYLIVIAGGRVRLAGDVDDLLAEHRLIITDPQTASHLSSRIPVVEQTIAARQVHLLARLSLDVALPSAAAARPLGIRELILAYLRASQATHPSEPDPTARRALAEVPR